MFEVGERTVYLSSLATSEKYEAVYQKGKNYLDSNPLQNPRENILDHYQRALKILENGIKEERRTEQQYFNNLLKTLDGLNKDERESFKDVLNEIFPKDSNDGSIDYMKFINFINKLLLGLENYQKILTLEKERGIQLEKALNDLRDAELMQRKKIAEEKQRGNQKIDENLIKQKIEQEIRDLYLERHSYNNTDFSKYFSNVTNTIDYLLAKYVRDAGHKILTDKNTLTKIANAIKNKKTKESVIEFITEALISKIKPFIPRIVDEALLTTEGAAEGIITDLNADIDQFAGIGLNMENYSINEYRKTFSFNTDEKGKAKSISTEDTAENLLTIYKAYLKQKEKFKDAIPFLYGKDFKKILKLKVDDSTQVKDQLDLLKQLDNKLKELKRNLKKNPQDAATIKQQIKDQEDERKIISKKIRDAVKTQVQLEIQKKRKITRSDAIKIISEQLTFELGDFTITGPELSEIVDLIFQQVNTGKWAIWSGKKNLKADTIHIQHMQTPLSKKTATALTKITQQQVQRITNKIPEIFYNSFSDNLPKSGQATNFKVGKKAFNDAADKLRDQLTTELKNNASKKDQKKEVELEQAIAEQIKNTIIVTETMKTFNSYNSQFGFVSGSLGGDIQTQIDNIAELFESAGAKLEPELIKWLYVAIVNCSPDTLGFSNRTSIEHYLSVLAGFAVFDEGSAEIEMINKKTIQKHKQKASPRIMHLYRLNGLYFPGSYILQRMYDNLSKIIYTSAKKPEKQLLNNDGLNIRATFSIQEYNKISKDKNNKEAKERWDDLGYVKSSYWEKIYQIASTNKYTSLDITFLSGLFDIVEELIGSFNKI